MSLEKPSTNDEAFWIIIAGVVGVALYIYRSELMQAASVFVQIVVVVVILLGLGYILVRSWTQREKANTAVEIKLAPILEVRKPSIDIVKPSPKQKPLPFDNRTLLQKQVHLASNLDDSKRSYLENNGYELREFVPIGKQRREEFYIIKASREQQQKIFLTHNIVRKLEPHVTDVMTEHPDFTDIVVFHEGKEYGLQVLTQHRLKRHKQHIEGLKSYWDEHISGGWWIVVSKSAYKKSFTRYTKVLRRNDILPWIAEHFASPNTQRDTHIYYMDVVSSDQAVPNRRETS